MLNMGGVIVQRAVLLMLGLCIALLASCGTETYGPAGGTPYGIEERSHGHP